LPLQQPEHRHLASRTTPAPALAVTAEVTFIDLDLARQKLGRFGCQSIEDHLAQKALVFKQGEERTRVAGICRKAGISQTTYFNWKTKYAGLLPTEMRRLRELEDENSRLKKIAADLTLDREMLQDIVRRKL
jgi:putative transposase